MHHLSTVPIVAATICFAVWMFGTAAHASAELAATAAILPVDEAFEVTAQRRTDELMLRFRITRGHYLYRERASVRIDGELVGWHPDRAGVIKQDEYFGEMEVWFDEVAFRLARQTGADDSTGVVAVTFQGCAEGRFCYPPTTRHFDLAAATGPSAGWQILLPREHRPTAPAASRQPFGLP